MSDEPRRSGGSVDLDGDRVARLLLSRLAEPADTALAHAIATLGPTETVDRLRAGTLAHRGLVNLRARLAVASPDRDLAAGAAVDARFIIPGDANGRSKSAT